MSRSLALLPLLLVGLLAAPPARGEEELPFSLQEIPSPGRTAMAELVELDGDGRTDLLSAAFSGLPPAEKRELRAYYQRPDGTIPQQPDWVGALPPDAAAYDLADLVNGPGVELVLLRRDGVGLYSFAGRKPELRALKVPGPTIAAAPDERGMDPLSMVRTGLGPEPRILVPGLSDVFLLASSGELISRMDVGARANYFIPPRPGPLIGESEIEIYLDIPRLDVGDVDGDGRGDIIATNRHEVRVFHQRPDATFPTTHDLSVPFEMISETDHIRSSGAVRADARDFSGDGRVDLLVSHVSGGVFRAKTETGLYTNRGGTWNLAEPDQSFTTEGAWRTYTLLDLDNDGRVELISARVPLSVLEMVEVLVTSSIDVELEVRGQGEKTPFAKKPYHRRKLDVAFSFETYRAKGFIPSLSLDLNGDGHRDLLTSGDGEAFEVYLGGPAATMKKRVARQQADTSGVFHSGDLDGDGLPDFVLHNPRVPDSAIRIGVNRGVLPGTRRKTTLSGESGR